MTDAVDHPGRSRALADARPRRRGARHRARHLARRGRRARRRRRWCASCFPRPAARTSSGSPGRRAPARARWSIGSRWSCAGATRRSASSPSIPPARTAAAPFSATASACRPRPATTGVFIRSMATRGHLGGLVAGDARGGLRARRRGKDWVVIETVGVGQDEVDIVRTADVAIVVAGAGHRATRCRRSRPASWRSPTSSW